MKRLLLRFENNIGIIIVNVPISIFMGWAAWAILSEGDAIGCLPLLLCLSLLGVMLYLILRISVIVDFRRNYVRLKADGMKKKQIKLDCVKELAIVFSWMDEFKCYSAEVNVYLKNGRKLTTKFVPRRSWSRFGYITTGKISKRLKKRIEKQVSGCDFIVCRTKQQKDATLR